MRLRPNKRALISVMCSLSVAFIVAPPRAITARAGATFNVVTYGADATGAHDSTTGVQDAINAAQAAGPGNTVYFPTGTYIFSKQISSGTSISVLGTVPVTLLGDGATSSYLIEEVGKNLMSVQVDGTVVNGLNLNTQPNAETSSARAALVMSASNTTLEYSAVYGGPNTFALYYPGPPGASRTNLVYDTGNDVNTVTINDEYTRDGFSYSYQANSTVEHIDHTGSRMAIFTDHDVTIDDYHYHPGTQAGGTQGWWITPPSENITINGFVTDGNGGTIGANTGGNYSSNITIENEVFNNPGFHLSIGEVQGLTISNCDFGSGSDLRFIDDGQASGVVVENCTSLPMVHFDQPSSGTVSAEFDGDTYPTFTAPSGTPPETFVNSFKGPTDFTINNGTFQNCAGGLFKGSETTFVEYSLAGYPCSADTPPTAMVNVSPSSGYMPLAVTADASGSTAGTSPIWTYSFDWGDGTSSSRQTTPTATHTYSTAGSYTVTATVADTLGVPSTATATVTVNPASPPNAALTVTPNSGAAPLSVDADASASTAGSSPISTYTFNFGDGTVVGPQSGATTSHSYHVAGSFTVTVTVTDTGGLSSQATQGVVVSPPANLVGNPGFEAGLSGWAAGAGTTVTLSSNAHSGSEAADVMRKNSSGRGLLTDSPGWNNDTAAGETCTVSAWVQASIDVKVFLRSVESAGTSSVSKHLASVHAVAGQWTQLTLAAPIVNGGDNLHIAVYAPLAVGQSLFVDDVYEGCA